MTTSKMNNSRNKFNKIKMENKPGQGASKIALNK